MKFWLHKSNRNVARGNNKVTNRAYVQKQSKFSTHTQSGLVQEEKYKRGYSWLQTKMKGGWN